MDLQAQVRDIATDVRALRKEGKIPAELYGKGVLNVHLVVDEKEFSKVFREAGENTVLTIHAGKEKHSVLVHDIERNYLSDRIDHVDFHAIRMDEKIKAKVPLEFIGESPAVKEQGGLLNKTMAEIEVEALPAKLPHRIAVDVSKLVELNQTLYVKDLDIPEGVILQVDPATAVATVTPPLKEEEIAPVPVDVTSVKVETDEKKEEREKAKGESETPA